MDTTWLGTRSASRSNHHSDIRVRISPLSGIVRVEHEVERRDPVAGHHQQPAGVRAAGEPVEVAHLAGVEVLGTVDRGSGRDVGLGGCSTRHPSEHRDTLVAVLTHTTFASRPQRGTRSMPRAAPARLPDRRRPEGRDDRGPLGPRPAPAGVRLAAEGAEVLALRRRPAAGLARARRRALAAGVDLAARRLLPAVRGRRSPARCAARARRSTCGAAVRTAGSARRCPRSR